ncbi:hypothetical protein C4D60_Mb02t21230 [Musa balbisiana]|uniref:Uncharacterized protein n=1 Tax=Musa balbisiana TaxID=52838 RepID=A0A4V4H2U8_MUSBA|nr:hypothetical protein C4D60_Mb02t21230 [Musa balbisiana]
MDRALLFTYNPASPIVRVSIPVSSSMRTDQPNPGIPIRITPRKTTDPSNSTRSIEFLRTDDRGGRDIGGERGVLVTNRGGLLWCDRAMSAEFPVVSQNLRYSCSRRDSSAL